jgi:hypothetical protein
VRFNGPLGSFNHFAQDSNFNRGAYRSLEDQWAKSMKAGHVVTVKIDPQYTGGSLRPDKIDVYWTIDGVPNFRNFINKKKGN